MLKSWAIFLTVALTVAGCANAPVYKRDAKALPPDWDSELGPTHELEEGASEPVAVTNPAPVSATNAPVAARSKTPPPLGDTGMISLSRWAAHNGLGAVRVLPLTPVAAHVVKTPYGNLTVRANSLSAYWGRVEIRLGFKPQQVGDQLYLHALDLKKILEPLAHGTTVFTSASRLVVIDPGHGGANSGTRNVVTGRFEKDYTLDWALRLGPLLEQSGWRVAYTRTNDVTLSLAERVAVAEKVNASLFLSLHFNATGDGNAGPAGLETYCLTPAGMPSSITRGYNDNARQVFPNNRFDIDNLRYAVRIHSALLQVNGHQDRGVRHARFLDVLAGQNRPAVLIEGGYLSNPTEARQVATADHRQKLAEAVARALE